jgi:gamma-glutamyltranspeptidase / glutathione hydrolase
MKARDSAARTQLTWLIRIGWCCLVLAIAGAGAAMGQPIKNAAPSPLAEGRNGVVVGTTGNAAVHAGLEALQGGGSAADAAVVTALTQVVECGGAYVSHAGILSMVYFEAKTGKLHYLNACYDTPANEKDPLSIPTKGKPSGRTALVPGFMAGIQAMHDQFGKLPRKHVFKPAIDLADGGFRVEPMLARFISARKAVLTRLPETKRIFSEEKGELLTEGDWFRQPELAATLRQVADQGAGVMYTGSWAEQFVAAVQKQGGKITLDDLKNYRVIWEAPLQTTYRDHEVALPGFTSHGGVSMVEALHLLAEANLPKDGHYSQSPTSLFWLMQISHCQVLSFLPSSTLKKFQGLDLSPPSRLRRETSAAIWKQMQEGKWPFAAKVKEVGVERPAHSDGIVVADRWGNVAAVTHSINTTLWGDTGLFVAGISIPDSASFQQAAIKETGPGKRLADPMCPLIVLRKGQPVLASSAIGGGLHPRTLQILSSVLDFGMDAQTAVEEPAFLLPEFTAGKPIAQVESGQFGKKLVDSVAALGQQVKEINAQQAGAFRGYWVGVQLDPAGGVRRAVGTRKGPLPSRAEGY